MIFRKNARALRFLLLFSLSVSLCSCRKSADPAEETSTESSEPETALETTAPETEPPAPTDPAAVSLADYAANAPSLSVDYNACLAKNSDYAGFLNIPGTKISYPVTYRKNDNDYYLHRAFETRAEYFPGTLFIDGFSEKGIDQDNLIIYGHNMKDGSMFGTEKQFKNADFFAAHPYIEFYTKDECRIYLVFSARTVPSDINNLSFALEGFDPQDYISTAISASDTSRQINLSANGFETLDFPQIITLSTCVGDYSWRLHVSGVLIRRIPLADAR